MVDAGVAPVVCHFAIGGLGAIRPFGAARQVRAEFVLERSRERRCGVQRT